MKKITSLILALAMCLALTVPAFATETTTLETELESMLPTLAMTLPDASTIILNPYRMAYNNTNTVTGIDNGDRFQIMNTVFSVLSETMSKVKVTASITGEATGDATLASAAVAPGDTGKNVYLTLTYATSNSSSASIPVADSATPPSNVVTISGTEQTKTWDLDPATTSNSTTVPQRIDMQFSGSCSDTPEEPWSEDDGVSCAIVFEAIPVTDIPMIALTYQSKTSNPDNLTFNIPKPSDVGATPAYAVTKIQVGNDSATAKATTTLAVTNATWVANSAQGATDTIVTLDGATIGATTALHATTADAKKYVIVTLTYSNNATTTVTKTIQYELKVTVKKNAA